MKKRSRLARVACVAASSVILLGTSPAQAADPVVVSVLRCADEGASVPAGASITLHLGGYAEGNLGLMTAALSAQRTTLDVSGPAGETLFDLSNQWSAPVKTGFGFWLTTQPDKTISPLASGETYVVTYDISFSHPLAVLFTPVKSTGDNGPFVITEDGPSVCEITAA